MPSFTFLAKLCGLSFSCTRAPCASAGARPRTLAITTSSATFGASAAIQLRQHRLRHVAAKLGAATLELGRQPRLPLRPRNDERQPDGRRGVRRRQRVLALLD